MTSSEQKAIFESWLAEHKGILFKIIRAYAFTAHDRDDLFQEIALQLWRSIPDFRGESKPSTWIYRVALFAATVWLRGEKKEPPADPLFDMEQTLLPTTEPLDERLIWLYEQIGKLEPVDRSLCLLLLEGFSYKEMADMVGISQNNVGVKIHRIKKFLQEQAIKMTGTR